MAKLPTSTGSRIDPDTLMRIKSLQMRARVVVEGFLAGLHRSPYHGFSVEFSEYRQYTPGDDPRYLDWRLVARSDRYYVKRFEDETNLRCYLLVDLSRSMGYASGTVSKADYARTLAATLAYYLARQRDAVGLLTFDEQIRDYLPARFRPGHLHRLIVTLEQALAGSATNLVAAMEQIAQTVAKRGVVVLLSDLLAPVDRLQRHLGYLRARGHEVVLFRILDPTELSLQISEPAMFHDLETGREMYIDPSTARAGYERAFQEHREAVRQIAGALGAELFELTTDQPLDIALFDFLAARQRSGRLAARTQAPGAAASRPRAARGGAS